MAVMGFTVRPGLVQGKAGVPKGYLERTANFLKIFADSLLSTAVGVRAVTAVGSRARQNGSPFGLNAA
jgi:hypothetical protein